jgi:hypothetical protein
VTPPHAWYTTSYHCLHTNTDGSQTFQITPHVLIAGSGGLSGQLFRPAPSRYSVYGCTGTPHDIEPNNRACRFHHVCLDHNNGDIVYFLDPDRSNSSSTSASAAGGSHVDGVSDSSKGSSGGGGVHSDFNGVAHEQFPDNWVSVSALPPWILELGKRGERPAEEQVYFAPRVSESSLNTALCRQMLI